MEIAIIATLTGVVRDLYNIATKVEENKEQCLRLCLHINSILDVLEEECKNGPPPMLARRIIKLSSALLELTVTLEGLHKGSFLQRVIWRKQVAAKVQELYRYIVDAVQDVKLGIAFDVSRAQAENEQARQADAANTRENFDRLLNNDKEIIGALEVQQQQMQEAVVSLHRYLEQLPESSERRYLQNGMYAMQRRSGSLRFIPDVFVITSLDVIIHYDKRLGEGGFTRVYEGLWKGTKVAVKVMEKGVPASAIQQEVDIWKRLRHPHILEFYGACSIADPPFMVCAYKENGDAVDYLRRFPNAHRRQLLYEAVIGLVYLHENGVVHGDIKASNILVDKYGRACISDFGLSQIKIHTTTIRGMGNNTQHGTARWMAPEHMVQGVTSKKSDVYSFGMTMYEVFTGFPPFAGTPEAMLLPVVCDRQIRPARPDDGVAEKNGLNDELWMLMCRAWAHEPRLRPIASELSSQLARHAALVRLDLDDEEPVAVQDLSNSAPGNAIPALWHDLQMTPPSFNGVPGRQASDSVYMDDQSAPPRTNGHPRPSTSSSNYSIKPSRPAPPSPSTSSAKSRLAALETPSMQSMNSFNSTKKEASSRPGTRQGAEASGSPYVSRAARELVAFLDEGPPEEVSGNANHGAASMVARPTTPKKATALSQLPHRIRKISRRQKSTEEKVTKVNVAESPSLKTSTKPPVSPETRELIDFLEEGPPEDTEPSSNSSKQPSPSSKAFFDKLQPFGRNPRRSRPKNLSLDLPGPPSPRDQRMSPYSPGSSGSSSQPYISQSARDLVDFLNEGPPPEVRRRQRPRDGSVASEESTASRSSLQRLRGMFSRAPQGGESTELLVHDRSRPPSVASADMFLLPLPGDFDTSVEHTGPVVLPSEVLEFAQRSVLADDAATGERGDEVDSELDSSSVAGALVVAQPTPATNIATPALVVFSSVVLYMLFSMPFS